MTAAARGEMSMTVNAYRAIVEQIAMRYEVQLSYDPEFRDPNFTDQDFRTYIHSRQANRGWTIETPGSLGATLVTEGVYLDPETLDKAIAEAKTLCLGRLQQQA